MNITPEKQALIDTCKRYKEEHGKYSIDFIALKLLKEMIDKQYKGSIPEEKKASYEELIYTIKEIEHG